jgi:uncharacterized repeat protein (TIGR03803 family)
MPIFARSLLVFGALTVSATLNAARAADWPQKVLLDFTETGAATGLGHNPQMGVLIDSTGMYGSAYNGGSRNGGTVYFRSGGTLKPLFSFSDQPFSSSTTPAISRCGFNPSARLVKDPNDGSLYGTTYQGGQLNGGVVFQLVPNADPNKGWTCNVLYSFANSGAKAAQGYNSFGGLLRTPDGSLYGTAQFNARTKDANGVIIHTGGVVFRLRKTGNAWTYTVLHTFSKPNKASGLVPSGPLTESNGMLYGATFFGGVQDGGVIYRLPIAGAASVDVLHTFNGNAASQGALFGYSPTQGPLLVDSAGVVYGETTTGGKQIDGSLSTGGVVFQLTPRAQPPFAYKVLYNFDNNNTPGNGFRPIGGVALGPDGFLYGATQFGGAGGGGSVFRLKGANKTVFELLYDFPDPALGFKPSGPLSVSAGGAITGTTFYGGAVNGGVIFRLTKP